MVRNFDPRHLSIVQLMDALQDLTQEEKFPVIRAEIERRAQSPAVAGPDVMTAEAILERAVNDLRNAGWYDIAHACLVVFANATPDPGLLFGYTQAPAVCHHNGELCSHSSRPENSGVAAGAHCGLANWIVGSAQDCARPRWSPATNLSCRADALWSPR